MHNRRSVPARRQPGGVESRVAIRPKARQRAIKLSETIQTTAVTLLLGMLGFALLSWDALRSVVFLYPELILLLIPLNILIGRYFGLRVTEYIKFQPVIKHGSK